MKNGKIRISSVHRYFPRTGYLLSFQGKTAQLHHLKKEKRERLSPQPRPRARGLGTMITKDLLSHMKERMNPSVRAASSSSNGIACGMKFLLFHQRSGSARCGARKRPSWRFVGGNSSLVLIRIDHRSNHLLSGMRDECTVFTRPLSRFRSLSLSLFLLSLFFSPSLSLSFSASLSNFIYPASFHLLPAFPTYSGCFY